MSNDLPTRDIGGLVGEWLRAQYSGLFRELENTVNVAQSFTRLVGADPERISLTFVNSGPGVVQLSTRADITAGFGIRLRANGGLFHVDLSTDYILPMLGWFATPSGVVTDVYVLQVKRDIGISGEEA